VEDLAHRRLELIILKDGALEGSVDLGAEELPNGSTVLLLSVRKVVPTLTSKSAEIYLSMAGAKQLVTRGLS
jgi:hypothetical protein